MTNIETVSWMTPIFIGLISFILIYISLKKLEIVGNNATHAILSALIAFIFATTQGVTDFIHNVIPWFAVLTIILFLSMLVLAFVAGDIEKFTKPLAIMGFVAAIAIVMIVALDVFPTFYHLLPTTSNAHLNTPLENLKEFIYSNKFMHTLLFLGSTIGVGMLITKQ